MSKHLMFSQFVFAAVSTLKGTDLSGNRSLPELVEHTTYVGCDWWISIQFCLFPFHSLKGYSQQAHMRI